jgi:hypothetical protein
MSAILARIYGTGPAALGTLAAYQLEAGGARARLARAYRRGRRLYLEDVRRGTMPGPNHDAGRQAGKE